MATLSAAGAAPGLTVSTVDLTMPIHVAVIVADVCVVTVVVDTLNVALDRFALTTVSAGTVATAGLLLLRLTTAPSGIDCVKLTVPVELEPPVTLVGLSETALRLPPAGGAGLTLMFAVRGTLSTEAVICTGVNGADAVDVMVKVTSCTNAGTTMLAGTWAADGALENSSTVVGAGSGKAICRKPVVDAPLLTMLGWMVRPFRALADATPGTARTTSSAARDERRRMVGLLADRHPGSTLRAGDHKGPLVLRP